MLKRASRAALAAPQILCKAVDHLGPQTCLESTEHLIPFQQATCACLQPDRCMQRDLSAKIAHKPCRPRPACSRLDPAGRRLLCLCSVRLSQLHPVPSVQVTQAVSGSIEGVSFVVPQPASCACDVVLDIGRPTASLRGLLGSKLP